MTGTRGRRGLRWLVAAVVIVAVAVVAWTQLRPIVRPDRYERPEAAEMPPSPADVDAVRGYLAGEGGRIVALRDSTKSLTGDAEPGTVNCEQIVASTLPTVGSPTQVVDAAAGFPDGPTAEIAMAYVDALRRWLAVCTEGTSGSRDELIFTGTILDRRLAEVSA